jgi:small nuclear ribonucleoprotein
VSTSGGDWPSLLLSSLQSSLPGEKTKRFKMAHSLPPPQKGDRPFMVMPLNVLEKSINKRVQLLLKDNRLLEGKLVGYDDYMNMVLEDTEETKEDNVRRVGTVVLRGNNVVTIVPK